VQLVPGETPNHTAVAITATSRTRSAAVRPSDAAGLTPSAEASRATARRNVTNYD
jgi:hypothetical protein